MTMVLGASSALTISYLDEIGFSFTLFQTILMFAGELLSSSIYYIKRPEKSMIPKQSQSTNLISSWFKKLGKKGFCVAAFCDFLSSIMITTTYMYMPAFTIMGFKMILILIMSLYRKLILRRQVYRHQFLGLGLVVIGILTVTFQLALVESTSWSESPNFLISLIFMILGQVFLAIDIIVMEYFMIYYGYQAETVLAVKGSSGLVISIVSYVPLHYIFASESQHSDLIYAFVFLHDHSYVAGYLVLAFVFMAFFNYFLVKTLKLTDCLAICTVDCGRMIFVWIFSYAIFPNEPFYPLEVVAALFLAFGLLVYNEVLILPFWGFDKSAYKTLRENDTFKEMRFNSRTWQMSLDSLIKEER